MGTDRMTPEERFWSKVDRSGNCWLWLGPRSRQGYGTLNWKESDGKWHTRLAHRIVFQLVGRDLPRGKSVLHSCDTPLCVRTEHLGVGTHQDNFDDMWAKGRQRESLGTDTHCGHGHPRIPENRYIDGQGYDSCRVCQNVNQANAHARRKQERLERKANAQLG